MSDKILILIFLTMKKLNVEKMASIIGGKFIGGTTKCGDCYKGTTVCQHDYYFLWIRVDGTTQEYPC
jgi:bacteriocin-like protein